MFVMLHAHWYQILSDLYRFLVPGRRESVSTEAFTATPPAFAAHCQQQCLATAREAIDFFVQIHDLPERKRVDDTFFGVIAYHCASIARTLSGRFQLAVEHETLSLSQQLEKLIDLLKESAQSNVITESCAADLESIVSSLGRDTSNEKDHPCQRSLDNPEYVFVSKHSTLPTTQESPSQQVQQHRSPKSAPQASSDAIVGATASVVGHDASVSAEAYHMPAPVSPLWQPAGMEENSDGLNFSDSDIFGLYNFAPDSTYYVDPFDLRFE